MESAAGFSKLRVAAALAIGFAGACIIWVAVPLNNYLLNSNPVADSYLPEIVLALLSILVLCINPLLGRMRGAWRITRRQLALVLGVWLTASVVPATGLLGILPYSLAKATQTANADVTVADLHKAMPLPQALFPDRLGIGLETPVSEGLLLGLKPGESIPWRAWLKVASAWAPLILGSWLMMIGLGVIVYPQWRERERLAFPLLTMYEALIERPAEGRHFAPVLRDRIFWAGTIGVLVLHSFNGLALHTGGGFPAFPLSWNQWDLFQDGVWRYAPWSLRSGRLYLTLVGIVHFMPNRTSFSIWFGAGGYAVYWMIKEAYFPLQGTSDPHPDLRAGAWVAYGLAILWLGRLHWLQVSRAMFSRSQKGTVVRDRSAGWLFLGGSAAMVGWFLWAGLSIGVSVGFVLFGILITLLAARLVCETGLPFFNFTPFVPMRFVSMFPRGWWTTAGVYAGGFVTILFNCGARICAGVMACLSMGLDRDRPPREQARVAHVLLIVLVAGVFVAGATHLWMACRHDVAIDGSTPIAASGRWRMDEAQRAAVQFQAGVSLGAAPARRWPFFIGGIVVAACLQAGCLASPRWPVHPIALLFMGSLVGDSIWPSILAGWLLKTLITRYGGAGGYRAARPLFLGLIMGEIFGVILWTIVPVVMVLCGSDPASVPHLKILLTM